MRELEIDGKQVTVFATRNDEDGGIITCTLVPAGDGSYYEYRTWEGRGIKGPTEDYVGDANRDPKEVEAEKLAAQERALAKSEALTISGIDTEKLMTDGVQLSQSEIDQAKGIAFRAEEALKKGISGKLFRESA